MSKSLILLCAAALAVSIGCKKKHPIKVLEDPELTSSDYRKVAIYPFMSNVSDQDDPERRAAPMFESIFVDALAGKSEYTFFKPPQVSSVLEHSGFEELSGTGEFEEKWLQHRFVDPRLLRTLGDELQADAVLLGVIDLWQKDEVEYYESGSSTTYVGATISLIRTGDGKVLWEASDEDYMEQARTEAGDRITQRSVSGNVQRVSGTNTIGGDVYDAPEYEAVVIKVVGNLLKAFPNP